MDGDIADCVGRQGCMQLWGLTVGALLSLVGVGLIAADACRHPSLRALSRRPVGAPRLYTYSRSVAKAMYVFNLDRVRAGRGSLPSVCGLAHDAAERRGAVAISPAARA